MMLPPWRRRIRDDARARARRTEPPPKKLKFPTAFTVLAAVLLLVWVASFFVPAGAYKIDPKTGGPVPGTYHELPSCSNAQGRRAVRRDERSTSGFKQLWIAPPNGLYGIENDRGFVSADEQGFLYGSAMIFLFVLAVGAFITVTMKTGAIQTGIGRLALRFRHSGSVLIAILMGVFALGGTTLRDVGGDARLLRPARPADARARLRPHGRRLDHLPRRRHRRAVLDGEPVRDRRRLRRRGHQPRRRDRRCGSRCGSCSSRWPSAT